MMAIKEENILGNWERSSTSNAAQRWQEERGLANKKEGHLGPQQGTSQWSGETGSDYYYQKRH